MEQYAEGQPEVTVARVTIPAGMALPLHEHPFMTAGVVLQGIIEVRTDSGKTHIARAGDAVVELVNQPHGGANIGDEDAVIWGHAGVEGQPVTVPITLNAVKDVELQPSRAAWFDTGVIRLWVGSRTALMQL